ncbi:hypothetical protein BCR36DRAFT_373130 [Piromyces finnis]|uniref:Extracellular membrane protein CFEM domain-containing protein n=1 Tax=Piromyces finnis TaxID=1754191 RepID=A0A1Y1V0K8_9FUNG|nr:hypothetical protein BCR36DRAFT_373130 [Piromyces finnis]|eukprot:ORX44655.1 hypothetical protein BCR36DRAFT_373130 [Piromyces finnis]
MNCMYFISFIFIVLNTINAEVLQSRDECYCQMNKNEIDPIVPCLSNPSEQTMNGCVSNINELANMNNQTCLALKPWSEIQRFMTVCTEISTEQLYAQWVVRSLCPNLDKDQIEISTKIAEKCVNFEDTKCLCENNLYKYKDLYSCFRQNDTSSSYENCKENGWIIDSSAIFNINYKVLPIGILVIFIAFFI